MNEYVVKVVEYGAIVTLMIQASDDANAFAIAMGTQGVTEVLGVDYSH